MRFAKQPTAYQLSNHPGCVSLVHSFSQIWKVSCLLYIKHYTLNLKCSRVFQTSIYHFQYVHQLGTEKRKLILDISPKQKSCFQHTFQTDFSLFFPSVHWTHGSYQCHVSLFLCINPWKENCFYDFSELIWLTQHGWTCQAEVRSLRFQQYELRLEGPVLTFWFCHQFLQWLCKIHIISMYCHLLPTKQVNSACFFLSLSSQFIW